MSQTPKPSPAPPLPTSEVADLLDKTRKLVAFHQSLGIGEYPLLPELKNFLAPHGPTTDNMKDERQALQQPMPDAAFPQKGGGWPGKQAAPRVSLADIRQELGECTRCALHEKRNALVCGMGNESAELFIIGDSPGMEDDRLGEPFRGEAGELLDKMLGAIGLTRKNVYISTLVKCHPPDNRSPVKEEIKTCFAFLLRQLTAVSPKVICTMGTLAAQTLLKSPKQLIHLRGRFHDYQGIPVMPTFHPDFLIRNPELKKASWEDLKKIKKKCSGKGR